MCKLWRISCLVSNFEEQTIELLLEVGYFRVLLLDRALPQLSLLCKLLSQLLDLSAQRLLVTHQGLCPLFCRLLKHLEAALHKSHILQQVILCCSLGKCLLLQ